MIDYRVLHDPADLEKVVSLQIVVWGLNPRNAVPSALLHVMALNGGLVVGAHDGDEMVGLLVSLVVNRGGDVFLWSHMTGTHPKYQRRGIGLELKRFQRRWALEQGYRSIGWTFDPLQRGNAWFNLHLLGENARMTSTEYHVNFYGDMDDDINRGMPSDRIEVCWQIDQPGWQSPTAEPAPLLVALDAHDVPVAQAAQWDRPRYAVPVPTD
ncbi:MAG: GNAT family N-acetyltransferase, partial [Anaerolineae bacterium]|nr:GNAT family N-acetyltransferase [Anaerolineae bacterium]